VVGEAKDHAPDEEIAQALFEALEQRVLPMFFDRDAAGLPNRWIDRMIVAASRVAKTFSSDRMVSEYLEQCYVPGAFRRRALKDHDRARLKSLVAWKQRLAEAWPSVRFESVAIEPDPTTLPLGAPIEIVVRLHLGALDGSEVAVELFEGSIEPDGSLESGTAVRLEAAGREGEVGMFRMTHRKPAGEGLGYTVRARPFHADLAHPNETGLVLWWGKSREARRYAVPALG
jgi:starch phosphorylase